MLKDGIRRTRGLAVVCPALSLGLAPACECGVAMMNLHVFMYVRYQITVGFITPINVSRCRH